MKHFKFTRVTFFATLLGLAAVVWASGPKAGIVTTTGGSGFTPNSATAGAPLTGATAIRVRVSSTGGTLTGGKVCAYYLPPDGGTTWVHNGSLDVTLSANVEADGGTSTSQQLPDLSIGGQYGRTSFVPCGLTGTGTSFTVTTETWGANFP